MRYTLTRTTYYYGNSERKLEMQDNCVCAYSNDIRKLSDIACESIARMSYDTGFDKVVYEIYGEDFNKVVSFTYLNERS